MRKLGRDQNEGSETLEDLAKGCHGICILGDTQNLEGYDHKQPAPAAKLDLLWARGQTT